MKLKKYDYLIIAILVLITVSSIVIPFTLTNKESGKEYVIIEKDGKPYKKFPLDVDRTVRVEVENGYNIVQIKDNSVKIIDADCPDKICVKDGAISNPGKIIVCLPHKLVVEIQGEGESELDGTAY